MSDLRGLIERVEKATGRDTVLGRDVLLACGWTKSCIGSFHGLLYMWSSPDGKSSFDDDDFRRNNPLASVDAALALVEKMRPGYRWGVSSVAIKIGAYPDGKTAYGEGFRAHVTKNSPLRPMPSTADAPTPPLAIILALLRSLDTDNKGAAHGAP